MDDRTKPNLPNTEASVRYYLVRFGRIQIYQTESFGRFLAKFLDSFNNNSFLSQEMQSTDFKKLSKRFGSVFHDPTELNNTETKLWYSVNSVRSSTGIYF